MAIFITFIRGRFVLVKDYLLDTQQISGWLEQIRYNDKASGMERCIKNIIISILLKYKTKYLNNLLLLLILLRPSWRRGIGA